MKPQERKAESKVRRQAAMVSKLNSRGKSASFSRGRTVKFNTARITVYQKGKYVGWVGRKEYDLVRRESQVGLSEIKRKGFFRLNFKTTYFEKAVRLKTGRMKKAESRIVRIATHTDTQRKYVFAQFKQRKIPITKLTSGQKLTTILTHFRTLGLYVSKAIKGT